jgi:hypothetical protein
VYIRIELGAIGLSDRTLRLRRPIGKQALNHESQKKGEEGGNRRIHQYKPKLIGKIITGIDMKVK